MCGLCVVVIVSFLFSFLFCCCCFVVVLFPSSSDCEHCDIQQLTTSASVHRTDYRYNISSYTTEKNNDR